mgnify:CR=1 FL=1
MCPTLVSHRTREAGQGRFSVKNKIQELVARASDVIAPMRPIRTFVARHPWVHLEFLPFEEVAYRFKSHLDLDLMPSMSIYRAAVERGELDIACLERRFQRWLEVHVDKIPKDEAEPFFRRMLLEDSLPDIQKDEKTSLLNCIKKSGVNHLECRWMIKPISVYLQRRTGKPISQKLNHQMIKWCKLFLDESQSLWTMPYREKGFFFAWRKLVKHDPSLSRDQRRKLEQIPESSREALLEALRLLNISEEQMEGYLRAHLLELPGWAGMLLWRSQSEGKGHEWLVDYLSVRLSLEWVLVNEYTPFTVHRDTLLETFLPAMAAWIYWGGWSIGQWLQLPTDQQRIRLILAERFDKVVRQRLWLEAWEDSREAELKRVLMKRREMAPSKNGQSQTAVQLLFCIDVRSEPLRRHLEREGDFETYGCAGFFGLPVEIKYFDNILPHASCPPIVQPQHKIEERGLSGVRAYICRKHTKVFLQETFHKMKQDLLQNLLLPELSGPILGIAMLFKTVFSEWLPRIIHRQRQWFLRKPDTRLTLFSSQSEDKRSRMPLGLTLEEQVGYVAKLLKSIGLTRSFAPLIVVCGHGSETTNNPFASALDCGACGGMAGGLNARLLAELCNRKDVRKKLAKEGIVIPEDTLFVAAEHNTTVNELRWLYVPVLNKSAEKAFFLLREKLSRVKRKVNQEQILRLPCISRVHDPVSEAYRRATNWSETRPEWGLAGNSAMVVGPRWFTKNCDLQGSVFLHSYDWEQDAEGELLAQILAGPVTVAQWINLQYYASSIVPHIYGSGDKTTQSLTAGVGVMQGNGSDLLYGLPWQSVMTSDREMYHAPLRLLVIIVAPHRLVERVLRSDSNFRSKIRKGWLRLVSVEPDDGKWIKWSDC